MLREVNMKENLKHFLINILSDAVFGAIAAVFAHIVLCNILPNILTMDFKGVVNLSLTFPEAWFKAFSYVNCFTILFGVRFIIAYLTGNYKYDETRTLQKSLISKIGKVNV